MKKSILTLAIGALLFALPACNSNQPPAQAIKLTAGPDPSLDNKIVSVEGYASLPTMTGGGGSLLLVPDKTSQEGGLIVSVPHGNDNNQMVSLPAKYQNSDLKLKSDKGETLGYMDYIRVTGEYMYIHSNKMVTIEKVTKIEKATPAAGQ